MHDFGLNGPPRPRVTLRVGVTGHRPNRLPPGSHDALADSIGRLLGELSTAASQAQARNPALFAGEPPLLRLMSSLAEGADRIAAHAALTHGYALACPLPFFRDDYARDFATPASREDFTALLAAAEAVFELDGDRAIDGRAYEAAGLMTLRQSDILVAVWDGKPASGRGGTAAIVQAAATMGIPVAWIDPAGGDARLLVRAPLTADADIFDLIKTVGVASFGTWARVAADLLDPPAPAHRSKERRASRHALDQFLAERERRRYRFRAYPMLLAVAGAGGRGGEASGYAEAARQASDPFDAAMGAYRSRLPGPLGGRLFNAFAWVDGLANYYGAWRRSAAVLNFSLAAAAVFLALITVLIPQLHPFKIVAVALEILVIVMILANTYRGRKNAWHERWIDYRSLAERLRLTPVLSAVGSPGARAKTGRLGKPDGGRWWTSWYHQALTREIGIPNLAADAGYRRAVTEALRIGEIEPQIDYQKNNAERMTKVDRLLFGIGSGTLILTLFVGVAYAVWFLSLQYGPPIMGMVPDDGYEGLIANTVTFLAGLAPAVGAAALGIREQGDFERRAEVSSSMAAQLALIGEALNQEDAASTLAGVASLVETSADIMTAEVGDWDLVFRAKPLGLP
jgi:hypothetical protein